MVAILWPKHYVGGGFGSDDASRPPPVNNRIGVDMMINKWVLAAILGAAALGMYFGIMIKMA